MRTRPGAAADRLEWDFTVRTRELIASELAALGLADNVLDQDQAGFVIAAGYAALLQILDERDHAGGALWTLAGHDLDLTVADFDF
jgi:hypothetical protein